MKELEVQYQLARYESQRKAQEQEASKSRQLTTQVSTFSQTETELRSQLNIYVEKFKQVCGNTFMVMYRRRCWQEDDVYSAIDRNTRMDAAISSVRHGLLFFVY